MLKIKIRWKEKLDSLPFYRGNDPKIIFFNLIVQLKLKKTNKKEKKRDYHNDVKCIKLFLQFFFFFILELKKLSQGKRVMNV